MVYTYTAELFPTSVRTIGLGIGSLGGGLGGVLAPYILALQVRCQAKFDIADFIYLEKSNVATFRYFRRLFNNCSSSTIVYA